MGFVSRCRGWRRNVHQGWKRRHLEREVQLCRSRVPAKGSDLGIRGSGFGPEGQRLIQDSGSETSALSRLIEKPQTARPRQPPPAWSGSIRGGPNQTWLSWNPLALGLVLSEVDTCRLG